MKQGLIKTTISIFSILIVLSGCSSNQPFEKSKVNSGTLDENYVGDANVQLHEEYKQTPVEAEIQAEILNKNEEESTEADNEGSTGHF